MVARIAILEAPTRVRKIRFRPASTPNLGVPLIAGISAGFFEVRRSLFNSDMKPFDLQSDELNWEQRLERTSTRSTTSAASSRRLRRPIPTTTRTSATSRPSSRGGSQRRGGDPLGNRTGSRFWIKNFRRWAAPFEMTTNARCPSKIALVASAVGPKGRSAVIARTRRRRRRAKSFSCSALYRH